MNRFYRESMEIYRQLYPEAFKNPFNVKPIEAFTLDDVLDWPRDSEFAPNQISLNARLLPDMNLNFAALVAAMDTVTGFHMLRAAHEIGACGVYFRTRKKNDALDQLERAMSRPACRVDNPITLHPDQTLEDADEILVNKKYSTIPVTDENRILKGILFTGGIAFKDHRDEKVSTRMIPIERLKTVLDGTPFDVIKQRLLNDEDCSVLPVLNENGVLKGIYFMKDVFNTNPSWFRGKPLVGMAINDQPEDLERVTLALDMGVGVIVVDSSHAHCPPVLEQARKVVKMAKGRAIVTVGNVADIGAYLALAEIGVDVVKCGIGSGATCTTSLVTGAGYPMFTLMRQMRYAQLHLQRQGRYAPLICPDGGIEGPGHAVKALAAGGDLFMAGKWFAKASQTRSRAEQDAFKDGPFPPTKTKDGKEYNLYRGMASQTAIEARVSGRYGEKTAPEGEEGYVENLGPLNQWIGKNIEQMQSGFAHVGAQDIGTLHVRCDNPMTFLTVTAVGMSQIQTRLSVL